MTALLSKFLLSKQEKAIRARYNASKKLGVLKQKSTLPSPCGEAEP